MKQLKTSNNIILCGYPYDKETFELTEYFAVNGINTSVLISSGPSDGSIQFRGTVICHTDIAEKATIHEEGNINYESLAFIRAKYPIVLRAMTRWDETITNPDDKLFIIDKMFLFFVELLQSSNTQAVLYGTGSPHHFYNLVLSYAAEYCKVGNVFPITNWITNRVRFVLNNYNNTIGVDGFGSGKEKMEKYLEEIKYGKTILSFDSARIFRDPTTKNYLLFLTKILLPKILGRMKFIYKREKDLFLNDNYSRGFRMITSLRKTIYSQYFKYIFKRSYRKYQTKELPSDSIILYAQNQPEATSHPDAGFYPDLRYWVPVLQKIREKVFYKEHKANFIYHQDKLVIDTYGHRSLQYLEYFNQQNVGLLSESADTATLMANNNIIFTFTGSIILESVIRGFPIYYCGQPFHGDFPETETVATYGDMVLKKANPIEMDDALRFFEKQDICSVPNYSGFSTAIKVPVPFEDYASHIVKALSKVFSNSEQNSTK